MNPTGHGFDVRQFLAEASERWNLLAAESQVAFHLAIDEQPIRIAIESSSLTAILDYLAWDAIQASVPGSRVEVTALGHASTNDWIVVQLRDFSGGRDDAWQIAPEILAQVRRLDGYLDVQVETGRVTQFSLTLPTNCLSQWFRARKMSDHLVCIEPVEPIEPLGSEASQSLLSNDRRINEMLGKFGAVKKIDGSYLIAMPNVGEEFSNRFGVLSQSLLQLGSCDESPERYRLSYLGPIHSFLDRLEETLLNKGWQSHLETTHTAEEKVSRMNQRMVATTTRLDPSAPALSHSRLRPRRRVREAASLDHST
jgi:hypothetical protein